MSTMVKKEIYNLEFPSWCQEMSIFGYRFSRVDDYRSRLADLQHFITTHAEFTINKNLQGKHSITAYVDIPDTEEKAVIGQRNNTRTALNDILLLLSLFTRRDVFTADATDRSANFITADPREYGMGGVLRCSIPYKNKPIPDDEPYGYDIGFEEGINQVYSLVRSEDWQRKYNNGHFLLLARQGFRRQPLETVFIQCWTIWDHLFSILNSNWLSNRQITQISSFEKIAFLIVAYALKNQIDDSARGRIESLAIIRNRLIHFGFFPDNAIQDNAVMFAELTEFVIAKILGLSPYGALDTMAKLEEFLKKCRVPSGL
jgi:hypothetical protein